MEHLIKYSCLANPYIQLEEEWALENESKGLRSCLCHSGAMDLRTSHFYFSAPPYCTCNSPEVGQTWRKTSCMCAQAVSRVWLSATPRAVARKAPLSLGFSKQECWSGLPFPSSGDLPDPWIEPMSPAFLELGGRFYTTVPTEKPQSWYTVGIWSVLTTISILDKI